MMQAIQIVGALTILAAYLAAQTGMLKQSAISYLTANAIGSAALAAVALLASDWGFVLLEGAWSITSLVGLLGQVRRARPMAGSGGREAANG